ncbi:MAG: hypothetical protein ACD_83C00120G0003 [uncultured bacterium]|nr:MAG: hypothetical protein ACD_83C00120G0003 [uncultured bacterium]
MRTLLVLRVSDELLKIAADLPEVLTCSGIWWGDQPIDGPKVLLETEDDEEVRNSLPSLEGQCDKDHKIVILETVSVD